MTEIVKVKPQIMLMSLEGTSKIELIRKFSNLSLEKIITNEYPAIGTLKKTYGADKTEKVIMVLLADLSASFSDELSKEQIEELAVEISSSHLVNLSLEDVFMVCRNIKTSKNFGKLNVNKVLNAFETHFNKRSEAFYQHNLNKEHFVTKQPRINGMRELNKLIMKNKKKK